MCLRKLATTGKGFSSLDGHSFVILRQPATSATRVALVAGPLPLPWAPSFWLSPFFRQPATSATRVALVAGPFILPGHVGNGAPGRHVGRERA